VIHQLLPLELSPSLGSQLLRIQVRFSLLVSIEPPGVVGLLRKLGKMVGLRGNRVRLSVSIIEPDTLIWLPRFVYHDYLRTTPPR